MRDEPSYDRLRPSGDRMEIGKRANLENPMLIFMRLSIRSTKRQTAIEENVRCRLP
jgi:hypothetical protein